MQVNAGECDIVDVGRRGDDAAGEPDGLLDVVSSTRRWRYRAGRPRGPSSRPGNSSAQARGSGCGIPDMPYYVQKMRRAAAAGRGASPGHERDAVFRHRRSVRARRAWSFAAERGSAWTLMYPKLSVVIPEPDLVKVPLAYPIGRRRPGVCGVYQYLDRAEAKGWYARRDSINTGFSGRTPRPKQPRWSIMRNVLHWTRR